MNTDIAKNITPVCKAVRASIVEMVASANSGHPGGSLSSVELLVGLYFSKMRHDSKNAKDANRDRFILSKGHACPLLYSVLAHAGYIPLSEIHNLRKFGSILQGHPNYYMVNGLESSSGSLGQGLSISNGIALAAKLDNKDFRTYCLMGDGELQEGQVWEAVMSSAHYKLDNICALVDANNLQIDGHTSDVMNIYPLKEKFEAFGWHVIEIDGHDMVSVLNAYDEAAKTKGKPSVIVAKTVKGKGVSFMENRAEWHGSAPSAEQLKTALEEIWG
jgi:Transketolase, N-terminal subunit